MKKLKAKIGLKIISFGIWIYESQNFGTLDEQDKNNLKKLWQYHDTFSKALNEN
jgi:hypothetical protein